MNIAVIGSGIGGLTTACGLASKRHIVSILEKNASLGKKINEIIMEGYRFDTGPSLFEIPKLMDEPSPITIKNCIVKINKSLRTKIESYIEQEKMTPSISIEQNTLSKGVVLYGNSSHSTFSAFLRHPSFLKRVKSLYFIGGSVDPGGAIPLCLASAMIVDNEYLYNR